MGRLVHLRGNPHDETQKLLPWYATGQLDPADRLLVDSHLAACTECRDDLALERRLGAAIRELPLATDEQWDRMAAQLPRQVDDRAWWQQPVRITWFIGAQAAVVLLCVGLVASQRMAAPTPTYHVLGNASAAQAGNILVMFAPDVPARMARAAIEAADARLVKGPTESGVYVLSIAPGSRDAALETLRARREVTLAQPIDAPAP